MNGMKDTVLLILGCIRDDVGGVYDSVCKVFTYLGIYVLPPRRSFRPFSDTTGGGGGYVNANYEDDARYTRGNNGILVPNMDQRFMSDHNGGVEGGGVGVEALPHVRICLTFKLLSL